MKRFAHLLFLTAFLLFVATALRSAFARVFPYGFFRPVAECRDPVRDLGTIDSPDPVSCLFSIKNAGNAPLVVSDARVVCGSGSLLQVRSVPASPIRPGETASVDLAFFPSRLSGEARARCVLVTNDPGRPKIELTVQATESLPSFSPSGAMPPLAPIVEESK